MGKADRAKEASGAAGATAKGGSGPPSGSMPAVSAGVSATAAGQHWWAVSGGRRGAAQTWVNKHGCPAAHSRHLFPLRPGTHTAVAPHHSALLLCTQKVRPAAPTGPAGMDQLRVGQTLWMWPLMPFFAAGSPASGRHCLGAAMH